jgi:hypothetical protein
MADFTAGQLASFCDEEEVTFANGLCIGYIVGLSNGLALAGLVCLPNGVTNQQAVKVVKKRLADHPERHHFSAYLESGEALVGAFPCKPKTVQ